MREEDLFEEVNPDDLRKHAQNHWQLELKGNFAEWLEQVQNVNQTVVSEEGEIPDLYSFYEELCVLRNESSKSAKRSSDAFARLGDTLETFSKILEPIQRRLDPLNGELTSSQSRKHKKTLILALTQLMTRFLRIQSAFNSPLPKRKKFWSILSTDSVWSKKWQDLQSAFDILNFHLEALLKTEGVTRIQTLGRLFDPTKMVALMVENKMTPGHDHLEVFAVIEELSPGFTWDGEVIQTAEVRIVGN